MNKYLTIFYALLLTGIAAQAQSKPFKLNKSSGKLVLNLPGAIVEGYNGKEIVFSSTKEATEEDKRAEGLHQINGTGYMDNTGGLGINVADKGTTVEVNMVSREQALKILVPQNIAVSYNYTGIQHSTTSFKGIEGELEVSAQYNNIGIDNCTGPLSIKSIYGAIDISLPNAIKGPISLISLYGHVDLTMSPTVKADIKLSTSFGKIFAAQDFNIELDKENSGMVSYGNKITGKLNGGGAKLSLTSDYGKIYLRKN